MSMVFMASQSGQDLPSPGLKELPFFLETLRLIMTESINERGTFHGEFNNGVVLTNFNAGDTKNVSTRY